MNAAPILPLLTPEVKADEAEATAIWQVVPPLSEEEIRRLIQDYLSWEIVVNTPDAVIQALDIEARYQTSFWDALILQAAESCGAAVLYSEDLAAGQKYGAVQVVNPLLE